MHIKVEPKALHGEVNIISSKSLSHRYVIAAALAKGVSHIENVMVSDDLNATKKALESLNTSFSKDEVHGRELQVVSPIIDCMASGSTVRFLIPIAMLLDEKVTFYGAHNLPKRPLDIYEELFQSKGLYYERLTEHHLPVCVKGPLQGGVYEVRGDVSSQFVTGLLFALPLCQLDSEIKIIGALESKPYVNLTLDVLSQFGIQILTTKNGFLIPGNQTYKPLSRRVEGDFSQAAFFMVAGLLGRQMRIKGLNKNSLQGDAKIIDIIQSMNGKIGYVDDVLEILPSETNATTIDLKDIPDLGPVLMILAALSKGQTRFIHTDRLKIKESDRLTVMIEILEKFGVRTILNNGDLLIEGQSQLKGNQSFDTYNDHRIAMSLMIASIKTDGPIIIHDIEVINKSYPTFLEVFQSIGGQYGIIK